jgi:hypothetical protein
MLSFIYSYSNSVFWDARPDTFSSWVRFSLLETLEMTNKKINILNQLIAINLYIFLSPSFNSW